MGRSFGSQLAVTMAPADERAFLSWLREDADVQILALDAPDVDHVWLDALPPPGRNPRLNHAFVLWNKAFAWAPDVQSLAQGAGVADAARAPVIEYRRQPASGTSPDEGRLYWSRSMTPGGAYRWQGGDYRYDAALFQAWWRHAAGWVLQHGHAVPRAHAPPMHYLPEAWARHQNGGLLGRLGGWFKP